MLLSKESILKIFSWVFFIGMIFQLVNGLWPQISMFLFRGNVIFPNLVFKIFIFFAVLMGFIINRKVIDKAVLFPLVLFVLYLLFELFYFYFCKRNDIKYVLFGLNVYYYYVFLIPFLPSITGFLKERCVFLSFLLLFVVCSVLSCYQWYFNSPVLPVKSLDGYYEAQVWNFYNYTRAYSFFVTSYAAAIFYSLIGLGAIGYFLIVEKLSYKIYFSVLALMCIF